MKPANARPARSRAPFWNDDAAELRLGDWERVAADVQADAVICDPPYGERTHDVSIGDESRYDGRSTAGVGPGTFYSHWTAADVHAFVAAWSPRCRGWMVCLTSHDLTSAWTDAYRAAGRYAFAPVPCVMRGMSVRLCGDGPSSWSVYAMVARPSTREFSTWGTLAGAYYGPKGDEAGGGRGKPQWLMQGLVRDYSRAGDLIVDPVAGWGATCEAARSLGRRSIGIERDKAAITEARKRLNRPVQGGLFL